MAQTVYDPPVSTYTPLGSITLSSAESSVTFSSIPQTYRDLVLVFNGTTSTTGTSKLLMMNPNGTGTSGSKVAMFAEGSTPRSDTDSNLRIGRLSGSTGRGVAIVQFMDYSATDKHKTMLCRSSFSDTGTDKTPWAAAVRWASTSAITSLEFTELLGSSFSAGSTFSLYGIEA